MKTTWMRGLCIAITILGAILAVCVASLGEIHVARLGLAGSLHQWLTEQGAQAIEQAQRVVRGGAEIPTLSTQPPQLATPISTSINTPQAPSEPALATPTAIHTRAPERLETPVAAQPTSPADRNTAATPTPAQTASP